MHCIPPSASDIHCHTWPRPNCCLLATVPCWYTTCSASDGDAGTCSGSEWGHCVLFLAGWNDPSPILDVSIYSPVLLFVCIRFGMPKRDVDMPKDVLFCMVSRRSTQCPLCTSYMNRLSVHGTRTALHPTYVCPWHGSSPVAALFCWISLENYKPLTKHREKFYSGLSKEGLGQAPTCGSVSPQAHTYWKDLTSGNSFACLDMYADDKDFTDPSSFNCFVWVLFTWPPQSIKTGLGTVWVWFKKWQAGRGIRILPVHFYIQTLSLS